MNSAVLQVLRYVHNLNLIVVQNISQQYFKKIYLLSFKRNPVTTSFQMGVRLRKLSIVILYLCTYIYVCENNLL